GRLRGGADQRPALVGPRPEPAPGRQDRGGAKAVPPAGRRQVVAALPVAPDASPLAGRTPLTARFKNGDRTPKARGLSPFLQRAVNNFAPSRDEPLARLACLTRHAGAGTSRLRRKGQGMNERRWSQEIQALGDRLAGLTVAAAVELADYLETVHGIAPA